MISTEKDSLQDGGPEVVEGATRLQESGLLETWAVIRRRKGILIFGVFAGLILGGLYYFAATPIYESQVQILVMQKDANLPARGEKGNDLQNSSTYDDLLATHIQIFQSPRIVADAIFKNVVFKKVDEKTGQVVVDEETGEPVLAGWQDLKTFKDQLEGNKTSPLVEYVSDSAAMQYVKDSAAVQYVKDLGLMQSVRPSESAQGLERFDPVQFVIENLEVSKGGEGQAKDAHVLCAAFRGPYPDECKIILNALVESYQNFLGDTFKDTSDDAIALMETARRELRWGKVDSEGEGEGSDEEEAGGKPRDASQEEGKSEKSLADLEKEYRALPRDVPLAQLEQFYSHFRRHAPLLWTGETSSNPHKERLRAIQTSLSEIRLQKTQTQARLEVIEDALQGKDLDQYSDLDKLALLSDKDVDRLSLMLSATRGDTASEAFMSQQPWRSEVASTEFERLLTLLLREKEMLQDFGPEHPEVQKIREQIELTRDYLESKSIPRVEEEPAFDPAGLLVAHVKLLQHDLDELGKREKDLEAMAEDARTLVKESEDYELLDEMLRNEIARKRELYNAVVERLTQINLIKGYGGFVTEPISPVQAAEEPVAPILLLVLAIGGMAGLFLGSGLAWAVDAADRTFRCPEEVRQALQLPIMADVPALMTRKRKLHSTSNGDGRPQVDLTVVAQHQPKSRQAEAIRGLRTALYFSTHGGGQKVIQITSPHPKDGKTTIAANLAVSMAQSGKKVLLVDADLRHPRIHQVFDIERDVGLSNVIIGEAELPDAAQNGCVENLWILTSGPHPPNPSELLTLPEFEQFLEVARRQYDFVLLDSPPLLAVSDPAVVAPRVDGVLLTIRIEKNGRPGAVQARDMLASLGADVLGVVINGLNRDSNYGYGYYGSKYGYGYRYGYGYGYGYGYAYGEGKRHSHYYTEEEEVSKS